MTTTTAQRPAALRTASSGRSRLSPNTALGRSVTPQGLRSRLVVAATSEAPRRAVVVLPGLGNSAADYVSFSSSLAARGLHVETAQVARPNWLRNALGLRYPSYWQGTLEPRPTVDWYLNKVNEAVDAAKRATDGAPITLIAHSAGGWMGRVYMRDFGAAGIDRFVSLGSPHNPPPKDVPGVIDQTRGILTWVETNCPGAYQEGVEYATIAGKYIKGAPMTGGNEGTTFNQRIIGAGYQQVCGRILFQDFNTAAGFSEEWGDGVVPVQAALLEGSTQLVIDGVYHSPLGANDAQGPDGKPLRPWYGSESIIDSWMIHATGQVATEV